MIGFELRIDGSNAKFLKTNKRGLFEYIKRSVKLTDRGISRYQGQVDAYKQSPQDYQC